MISSMTAFARTELQAEWGSLVWEIRSVNHRYLELQFRLPENLRDLEPLLREKLRKDLKRGKVESSLYFRVAGENTNGLNLNQDSLKSLQEALQNIAKQVPDAAPANPLEILRWPGIVEAAELDLDEVKSAALTLFGETLDQLREMRGQEGSALGKLIEQRLSGIEQITGEFRSKLPAIMAQYEARFRARLEDAKIEFEPGRIEQELVISLQKADVDEELDRLETHVGEVKRTLSSKGGIGRRLDFLMQELNREANTLSSKAIDTDATQAAVELKVLIEQMREQIQNIE